MARYLSWVKIIQRKIYGERMPHVDQVDIPKQHFTKHFFFWQNIDAKRSKFLRIMTGKGLLFAGSPTIGNY